jgi:hypothetical protein
MREADYRYGSAFMNAVSWLVVKCGVAQVVVDFTRETANEALATHDGQRIRVRIGHQTYGNRPVVLYLGRE